MDNEIDITGFFCSGKTERMAMVEKLCMKKIYIMPVKYSYSGIKPIECI